jgi:hypothetical protein
MQWVTKTQEVAVLSKTFRVEAQIIQDQQTNALICLKFETVTMSIAIDNPAIPLADAIHQVHNRSGT